jgi:predicted secreted protein
MMPHHPSIIFFQTVKTGGRLMTYLATQLVAAALIFLTMLTPVAAQSLPAPREATASTATVLHLTETAQRNVPRDRLRADLAAEITDPDAAKVQAEINLRMNAALARIKALPDIAIEMAGYSVFQDRPDKGPVQWHGSQSLSLTAADFAKLLALVGDLQDAGLVVRGLAPELSREARQAVEDDLTDIALGRIRKRADRIAAALGTTVERFRDLNIGNVATPPMPLRAMAAAAPMLAQAPVAEPGEAILSMTAQADIVLATKP